MRQLIKKTCLSSLLILSITACTQNKPATVSSASTSSVATPQGYYRVQKGDTVYKIGRQFKISPQKLITWNNLADPNAIEVGQLIKIHSSSSSSSSTTTSTQTKTPPQPSTQSSQQAKNLNLQWPTTGSIIAKYNGTTNKGIDISGQTDSVIQAAATGKVMYVGNEIRGYGNLILIKHNTNILTAYAHNKVMYVKEGQNVTKGQKIATMGNSGTDTTKLHFEVRINGKAVDPLPYLPKR